jgi:pyruvate ferredoxin oxidoreductase gamma subunit
MFQIRIHGRRGQGTVTAAQILSVAAFLEGRHAQAFPSFGLEHMGAPMVAFCRIADKEIRLREPVMEPDCLIVHEPTLIRAVDIFAGLRPDGYLLVNANKALTEAHIQTVADGLPKGHAVVVPATDFARKQARGARPNAALLGAFAALTGLVRLDSVKRAIGEAFPGEIAAANIAAAEGAYEFVMGRERAARGASDAEAD